MTISRRAVLGGAAAATAAVGLRSASASGTGRSADRTVDVAVVGAGLAGLTAARDLVAGGARVAVLEARDRVGGRTLNHPLPGGGVNDLGGTWTGPTQDRITALARSVGMRGFDQPNTGDAVYYGQGRRSTYSDTGPTGGAPLDPLLLPDLVAVVTLLDEMSKDVPPERPWTAKDAVQLDSQTLQTWLEEHTVNPQTRAVASAALEAIFGAEAREVSLLYTLAYVAGAGNRTEPGTFERLINVRGGAQAQRFGLGAQTISLRVARALGDRVHLSAPVRRVEQTGGGAVVTADGLVVRCRHVVCAVPPVLSARIDWVPGLTVARDALSQRAPQGALIKVEALYDRPFWREAGLSGAAVSDTGPAKITYDVSQRDGGPYGLLGFVGGDEARRFSGRPAELRAAVLDNLATYFGPDALSPVDVVVQDWSREVWSRGCPVAVLPPGALSAYGPALTAPVGVVHWAGTETSGYWRGYMDGAVRSGERAAREVLAAL